MRGRSDARFQESLDQLHDRKPESWLDRVLKKRILLHLQNDQSVEGVLMEQVTDGVILRAAKLRGNDGKVTPMDGETWVPRDQIAFAQIDE